MLRMNIEKCCRKSCEWHEPDLKVARLAYLSKRNKTVIGIAAYLEVRRAITIEIAEKAKSENVIHHQWQYHHLPDIIENNVYGAATGGGGMLY